MPACCIIGWIFISCWMLSFLIPSSLVQPFTDLRNFITEASNNCKKVWSINISKLELKFTRIRRTVIRSQYAFVVFRLIDFEKCSFLEIENYVPILSFKAFHRAYILLVNVQHFWTYVQHFCLYFIAVHNFVWCVPAAFTICNVFVRFGTSS